MLAQGESNGAAIVLLFAAWLLLPLIPASIAKGKGHNEAAYYFFGLLFFFPALIVAAVIQPKSDAQSALDASTRADPTTLPLSESGAAPGEPRHLTRRLKTSVGLWDTYGCDVCGFTTKAALLGDAMQLHDEMLVTSAHVGAHAIRGTLGRFFCEGCSFVASTPESAYRHMKGLLIPASTPASDAQPSASSGGAESPTRPSFTVQANALPEDDFRPPSDYKICPDCAEEVRAAARKCRFCGYLFNPVQADNQAAI